jgi:hypothetical protein
VLPRVGLGADEVRGPWPKVEDGLRLVADGGVEGFPALGGIVMAEETSRPMPKYP